MTRTRLFLPAFSCFLAVFIIWTSAAAQEEEKDPRISPLSLRIGNESYSPKGRIMAGPLRLHPFFSEQITYDDNIYLAPKGYRKSDILFTSEAGFRADLYVLNHSFLLGCRAFIHNYLKESDANNIEQSGDLSYELKGKSLTITLKDSYQNLIDPVTIEQTRRMRRSENEAVLSALYEATKSSLELRIANNIADYKKQVFDLFDHNEMVFSVTGKYRYSLKTNLVLRADYGDFKFTKEDPLNPLNDYTYFQVLTGVDGEITGKTKYLLEIGFTSQNSASKPNPAAKEEFSGITALIKATHSISNKSSAEASFLRQLEYSVQSNYQAVDRFEGSFQHSLTAKITGRARLFFESATPGSVETGPQPRYAWRLGTGISAWYEIKDYLYAGFDYEYRRKLSHADYGSYYNNRVYFHLTLLF
jgi:hypothetical protein